jgi:hypothetical protein
LWHGSLATCENQALGEIGHFAKSGSWQKPGGVMTILRALTIGLVLTASLAGQAYAQGKPNIPSTGYAAEEEQKRKEGEVVDKQYKATLQRTNQGPAAKVVNDPWSNMRGGDDSKAKR